MDAVAIKCPSCGASLGEQNIDYAHHVAKCPHCNSLTSFREQLSGHAPPRAIVPLPDKFKVVETGNALTIQWRWYSPIFILLLGFCILWDAWIFVWYFMVVPADNTPWIFAFLGMPQLVLGVGLSYLTAAGFVNRTVISAAPKTLRIWHGPLPWTGRVQWVGNQIGQLFVKPCPGFERSENTPHNLCMLSSDGRRLCVIKHRLTGQQALFLEQEIERFLKLDDMPVGGELSRN